MRNIIRGRIIDLVFRADRHLQEIAVTHNCEISRISADKEIDFAFDIGDLVELSFDGSGQLKSSRLLAKHQGKICDFEGDAFRWHKPVRSLTRAKILAMRHKAVRAIRQYFEDEGFLEIQAPLLIKGTCPDPFVNSISAGNAYLSTSTEYQIKRLIAGGFERVFTLGSNFREGDIGDHHNPEFTMLEWARAYGSLEDIENDAEQLTRRAAQAVQSDQPDFEWNEKSISLLDQQWKKISIRQALKDYLGVLVSEDFSLDSIRRAVLHLNLSIPQNFMEDRPLLFSILIDHLQQQLGTPVPVFLKDWPAFMTSSAALKNEAVAIADRSELIMAGLEISDGFPWLTDAKKQEALFRDALLCRQEQGKAPVTLDGKYIEAIRSGMPPGAGMALGIDRLMMILTGSPYIKDVLAFSWDEV